MLGKTHQMTGIASALLVTGITTSVLKITPLTVPLIMESIIGGSIGGIISDFDITHSKVEIDFDEEPKSSLILPVLSVCLFLIIDYILGNGIYDYIGKHRGIGTIIGGGLFVVMIILSCASKHRHFSHSIIALLGFSISLGLVCLPLAIPVAAGFISHIILDLFCKGPVYLFYPKDKGVSLKLCKANGTANDVISVISTMIAVIIGTILLAMSFYNVTNVYNFLDVIKETKIFNRYNPLIIYLVVINVIAFILGSAEMISYRNSDGEDENSGHVLCRLVDLSRIIGGALGSLIAFTILGKKFNKAGVTRYISTLALFIAWVTIIGIIFFPHDLKIVLFNTGIVVSVKKITSIVVSVWLLFINIITAILFFKDRESKYTSKTMKGKEIILLCCGVVGGSIGGIVAMAITQRKVHSPVFNPTFYILLVVHVLVYSIMILFL